jgi:hypothetical protein
MKVDVGIAELQFDLSEPPEGLKIGLALNGLNGVVTKNALNQIVIISFATNAVSVYVKAPCTVLRKEQSPSIKLKRNGSERITKQKRYNKIEKFLQIFRENQFL